MKRYQIFTVYAIVFGVLIAAFYIKERSFRAQGEVPGCPELGFKIVDTLISIPLQASDSEGLVTFAPHPANMDTGRHINAQGFISPFNFDTATAGEQHRKGKSKVLVLGDSFTEGVTDDADFGKTFMEIVRHLERDNLIYNTGAGGTGPVNYELIARRYIPIVEPDMVLVMFCGGNDVNDSKRKPVPFIPVFYMTNAGFIDSSVPDEFGGVMDTPQKAYDFYVQKTTLLGKNRSFLQRVCRHSCILSHLYFKIWPWCKPGPLNSLEDQLSAFKHLRTIDSICVARNIPFRIIYIPTAYSSVEGAFTTTKQFQKEYSNVFGPLMDKVNFPLEFTTRDYISVANQHFNNVGNAKMALVVDSVIRAALPVSKH